MKQQQQIFDNENLEQLSLPKLSTTDSLSVRDIPCLFHSFPQQIDSSFHRHHNNNNTKLTLPTNPPFNTNETTTDQRQREPRRHQHACAGDIEQPILGTQPTQQIHSSSQQHQTHLLPSIPFFPLTIYLPPPTLQVLRNPALQTLCAPNLTDGGSRDDAFGGVCIGDENDQPSLDADLSSLVTGTFTSGFPFCYGGGTQPPLEAEKVCGVVPDGLFTTEGCS